MSIRWQDIVSVRPASECRPNGDPAPDVVAEYRVYFPSPRVSADPYQDGVVIEHWKDGRYYIIDCNYEFVDESLAEVEKVAQRLIVDNGWIDAGTGGITDIGRLSTHVPATNGSVQELFDSTFPHAVPRIVIRGGDDIPADSTCGEACVLAIHSAAAFSLLPEVDGLKVARIAADACEVYING